jgi:hypothetical protein
MGMGDRTTPATMIVAISFLKDPRMRARQGSRTQKIWASTNGKNRAATGSCPIVRLLGPDRNDSVAVMLSHYDNDR